MIPRWHPKDPNEVLDYQIDWAPRLEGDVIVSAEWIVPAGIVNESNAFTGQTATIWLSGGTLGDDYTLTNRVTTDAGRVMDQSVRLAIKEK